MAGVVLVLFFGAVGALLVESMELVEAGMAARHPELDAEATKALAWYWSYSAWK